MAEAIDLDKQIDDEEALELTLDGETFRVTDITQERMEEADRLLEASQGQEKRDPYIVHQQLAIMLGAASGRFNKVGYRKLNRALRLIWDHLADRRGAEGKGDGQAKPRA